MLGDTESERATVPVKPFTAVMVIEDVRATPVLPLTLVGFAAIVKS